MAAIRKPLQGISNIIRFNRHFYALSLIMIMVLLSLSAFQHISLCFLLALLLCLQLCISLLVSIYIYDLSDFYSLEWLNSQITHSDQNIININAGFDEISELLHKKFPNIPLTVFDFYDPLLHTEISIKRARNAYPPYPGTVIITTSLIPLDDGSADKILLIFAAHEVRKADERINFFKNLKEKLRPGGEIILVEHLRDIPNFLAYNIGFLHFVSSKTWHRLFQVTGFQVTEIKINPFVTIFSLKKHGD